MMRFRSSITRHFSASTCSRLATKNIKSASRVELEYVYGISSVSIALHSKKRAILDTIHVQRSNERKTTKKKDESMIGSILVTAKDLNIRIQYTDKGKLNNFTQDKPHQGIVLQASPRETIEIEPLPRIEENKAYRVFKKNKQGQGAPIHLLPSNTHRSPFWLALDEIQDPHNLGSILRTAHFFGVDGVLVCSKNSAPLSPAVSKVSSGAMEAMDVFSTRNLVNFLKESSQNGWNIVGAAVETDNTQSVSSIPSVNSKPTILVLGNEGSGLRTNVKNVCHRFVAIPHFLENKFSGSVDSLNVGVAAGILIYSFTK
ncbi:Putative RNA methyltransferase, TrmH family, group 3 [Rhizopus microsporus]|nr:Putative RNA methyltransferase, TrmH family, group 3 [Rhizopus microsporus]